MRCDLFDEAPKRQFGVPVCVGESGRIGDGPTMAAV